MHLQTNCRFSNLAGKRFHINSNMIGTFHMVSMVAFMLIVICFHATRALIPKSYGEYPFLMPNVHPNRVSEYLFVYIFALRIICEILV